MRVRSAVREGRGGEEKEVPATKKGAIGWAGLGLDVSVGFEREWGEHGTDGAGEPFA